MFWRFGFHDASSIDTLLDQEDLLVEALLEEDDLLQECKSKNARLMSYFQRPEVLKQLLNFVCGNFDNEMEGQLKYPYVATEVLCSEIWSIVETCVTHADELLQPFWEFMLSRTPREFRENPIRAANFAKVNSCFLQKKPLEMLAFIRNQPSLIERLLTHIETTPLMNLLVRIIQLYEQPGAEAVLEWLSSQRLIPRLVDFLAASHTPSIHHVASELIKSIITTSAPSPGQPALSEGLQYGPTSNRFARELASRDCLSKLISYVLHDTPSKFSRSHYHTETYDRQSEVSMSYVDAVSSSSINSMSVLIELIRKNNSDYFEPFLFHTLRNRLIQVQQRAPISIAHDSRQALENAMDDFTESMGIVHLGTLLELLTKQLHMLKFLLENPRSGNLISTTTGTFSPLTFERLRICELLAELLHCSNMSLLNRRIGVGPQYDDRGRLCGGLSALEELAQVISSGAAGESSQSHSENEDSELQPAKELPIAESMTSSISLPSPSLNSEDSFSDDDDGNELKMSTGSAEGVDKVIPESLYGSTGHSLPRLQFQPTSSSGENYSFGEYFKLELLNVNLLPTLLDLFFGFPWNNILHTVVYDFIHQILTGRMDSDDNRGLIIGLFRDARLGHRIVEAQNKNSDQSFRKGGIRLGYMGHLILMSEDIVTAFQHFPPPFSERLHQYLPYPAWEHYLEGEFAQSKKRDSGLLGGGKPTIMTLPKAPGLSDGRWARVDEEDGTHASVSSASTTSALISGGLETHFLRRPVREASSDFGSSQSDYTSDTANHFAQYLASEMSSNSQFDGSPDDTSDEEEDAGWLSQSQFNLHAANLTNNMNTLSISNPGVFDNDFTPSLHLLNRSVVDAFDGSSDDGGDDDFGPFTDTAAPHDALRNAPESRDNSESPFGDFGDFQEADGGDMTPTEASWTWDGADLSSHHTTGHFNMFEDGLARQDWGDVDAIENHVGDKEYIKPKS